MAKLSSSNGKKANVPKLRFPEFTEEWEASNIGEISTYIKGAPLSKADISETGTPFILYGELYTTYKEVATEIKRKTNCIVDKKYFSKIGDVVIPTSGETPEEIATATCVMTPNVILAGDLNIFRINDIDGRFFSYVINHKVNKDISRIAQGKSIVHIKGEEISKIQIKYPSDEEQQKILSFIELLSLKIEKQEQLIDKLKKYKRGALSALFPKKGEITPQYRFAGFTKPWEQRKLGELGTVSMCRRIFKEQTSERGDIPFYKIGTFGGQADAFISIELFEEYKSKYPYPKKGDILISASGSIGRTVEFTGKNEYFQDSNIVWLNHDDRLNNSFLKCFYSVIKWAGIEGSTIKRLYNDNILNTVISLPSVDEQRKIGTFFKELDNFITLHQHKYDTLLTLKNALLQQMFI